MTAQRQRINTPNQDDKPSVVEEEEDLELPLFDTYTIATATNNFSFTNKIGEGGFGPVYKVLSHYIYELIVKKKKKLLNAFELFNLVMMNCTCLSLVS